VLGGDDVDHVGVGDRVGADQVAQYDAARIQSDCTAAANSTWRL
jgi:hypothetical protein